MNSKNISQRSSYSAPLNLISNLLVQTAGVALVAIVTVVFTTSFAAVAYSGDLTPFLDRGIGLVLLGTGISAAVVGLTASTRGMVAHPQDAPLLIVVSATPSLLSAAAAAGAAPGTDAQFATFFAFLICSTMLTGLLLVLAGKLRLSFIVRYMPYPIIGGIIVSIGYLLIISSVSLIVQRPVDIYSLPSAFSTGGFTDWAPWAVGALAIFTAQRWLPATAILPVAIISAFLGFHLFLAITGSTLIEAEAEGLLLGPFPDGGFLEGFSLTTLLSAKWIVVFSHLPILVVLAPITALTCLIHTQAICRVTGKEPDLDRDLISNGLANVLGGVSGNLASFPAISTSVLGARFGINNIAICIATAGLCFVVALYGADFFGVLPRGLLAMVILYLGLDMLISTLVVEWRRLPFRDLAPSLAILGTTIIEGLFFGLAMGVVLSVFLFVASYARLPFIRTETNLAVRRSIVERGEPERLYLADDGQRVRILEVTGYLFFGTANVLREHVRDILRNQESQTDVIVLDFRLVRDVDTSAISSIDQIQEDCRKREVEVYITGITLAVRERFDRFGFATKQMEGSALHVFADLNDALQRIEEDLLSERSKSATVEHADTFIEQLALQAPDFDIWKTFNTVSLVDGETLVEEGAWSKEIFVLLEGKAAAILGVDTDNPLVAARFEPGALIGEMAIYQNAPRSATVKAEGPARFLRIDVQNFNDSDRFSETFIIAFHKLVATHLSQRLNRMTKLLQDSRA